MAVSTGAEVYYQEAEELLAREDLAQEPVG
jgi:hypothetical protein